MSRADRGWVLGIRIASALVARLGQVLLEERELQKYLNTDLVLSLLCFVRSLLFACAIPNFSVVIIMGS